MKASRGKQVVLTGLVLALVVAAAGLGVLHWQIRSSVDEMHAAALAASTHSSDDVAALMEYAASEAHSLSERNRAVWALGQLRDPRALPVLERYRTGQPCDHARFLCQREITKAVALCKGETPDFLMISGVSLPDSIAEFGSRLKGIAKKAFAGMLW